MATEMWDERLSPRKRVTVQAEVITSNCVLNAETLDISHRGLRLQLNDPLEVTVKIKSPEGEQDRRARLIWARCSDDGVMSCGLHFI